MVTLLGVVVTVAVSMGVVLQLSRVALALERTHGLRFGLAVAGALAAVLSWAVLRAGRVRTQRAAFACAVTLLAVVVGGLAGAQVLQADPDQEPDRPPAALPPVTQVIIARDFAFAENIITMAPGERAMELRNEGSVVHSVRIDSLPGLRLEAAPGASDFEAGRLQPGVHTFHCEMPGHRAAGMEGTLVVSS